MMKNEVKLIVNGDDFGRLREVNQGIVLAFKSGLINQTTLMVNMPYADEAVNLSKEYGFFDKVGLHINLTEGIPLTAEICECERLCKDGEFRRYSIRDLRHGLVRLSAKEHCALEQEIHAQIDKYVELGFPLMHVDSHHHVHNEFPIAKIIIPYAKAKGFKSMRIARNLFPYNNIGGW